MISVLHDQDDHVDSLLQPVLIDEIGQMTPTNYRTGARLLVMEARNRPPK